MTGKATVMANISVHNFKQCISQEYGQIMVYKGGKYCCSGKLNLPLPNNSIFTGDRKEYICQPTTPLLGTYMAIKGSFNYEGCKLILNNVNHIDINR